MRTPGIAAAILLVGAGAAFLLLVGGASFLERPLPGGLPLGNATAAFGLCALAGAPLALSARGTALRGVAFGVFFAAVAWLPVSVALAGNLALNFGGGRGVAWMVFSLAVLGAALVALLWALAARAVRSRGTGAT
ncbi:hypothetical protein [Luteimonas sp. R10]|uniref:hypothetical protein n=1 Tax=Luteimonas sp. R10 TaxID=3108176 RepID=UPI00308BDDBF|nr:hypothetical protein U3649_02210 [Luteimonas sp. R10]